MRVLLVITDEHAIQESLRAALPETDMLLFESDADKALRRLIALQVDGVIVDDAPRIGRQALLRVLDASPGAAVVVLSSHGDPESLASWTLAGARACVVKPFSCEQLCDAVNRALQEPSAHALTRFPAPIPRQEYLPQMAMSAPAPSASAQYQMALRWVSRTAGQLEDTRKLARSLVEAATDIFDAVRCAVLLESGGHVRVAANQGIANAVADSLYLSYHTGIMRWLEEHACLFDRAIRHDDADACKEVRLLGGRFAVPLMAGGRVRGALVVGEKASGVEFTADERDLLAVVGRCASTAFEKALSFRDSASQQNRINAILASMAAGVVTVLPNRTVSTMNQQAETILRVRAVDVLGRSVQKLGSGFADVVLRALADGKPRLREQVRDAAIGATLGMSVTHMGPEGVVVVFSRLPAQTVSRSELAYSPFWEYLSERVAQEIKNPMVAINTFAQLLPRKYGSEDFREAFGSVVQKEVARINGVVETLFAFAAKPDLALKRTDLNETIESVLRSFEEELKARSITVERDMVAEMADADVDPEQFGEAVRSVVQNSVDAMQEGGTLKVATRHEDGMCRIMISDTGPGVSPENAALVFMPFFSTKEQGMGLGLTTAKRIVEQHHGELALMDQPEGGASFSVTVPAARTDDEDHTDH